MWVGGVADGARVIVQGQDFVREGQQVEPVDGRGAEDRRALSSNANAAMANPVDYAISHARLTIATLAVPAGRGLRRLCDDPEGSRAGRQDPDHLRAAVRSAASARRTPSGCCSGRSRRKLKSVAQRQGDALDRLRGRRLRAARIRGRLRFQRRRSPTCAPRSTRPSATCRATPTSRSVHGGQPLALSRCWSWRSRGDLPERTLLRIARNAKNAIEQVPGVLSAELRGARDEAVEIIAEPMLMKSYGVSLEQLIAAVAQQSNSLVAAGALEGATGPLRREGAGADRDSRRTCSRSRSPPSPARRVTLGDVAQVQPTFKDATSITRVNGQPAMTIEVSKRTGANLIETVDGVKKVVEQLKKTWPAGVAGLLHAGQVEDHPPDAGRPAEFRSSPACCWSSSSSCSRSAAAPRCSSASRSRRRSSPACSACSSPG